MIAALCTPLANAATLEVLVRNPAGAPVADAAVYAVPASGPSEARKPATVFIQQIEREFVPFVTVLQVGTPVEFPNRDPILHHVYSFSPAKNFEIKLYGAGKAPTGVVFDKLGVVTLGCNIHDWMIAYIVVVPTPHFGRTDASGVARMRDLPAGAYEVRAYHPLQRVAAAPLFSTLEASAAARVAFTLDTVPRAVRYKPPLDRARY